MYTHLDSTGREGHVTGYSQCAYLFTHSANFPWRTSFARCRWVYRYTLPLVWWGREQPGLTYPQVIQDGAEGTGTLGEKKNLGTVKRYQAWSKWVFELPRYTADDEFLVNLLLLFETRSHYVAHTRLKITAFLITQPFECWDYRRVPPYTASANY